MSRSQLIPHLIGLLTMILLAACSVPPTGGPTATTQAGYPPVNPASIPTQDPAAYPVVPTDDPSIPTVNPYPAPASNDVLFLVTLPDGNTVNVTRASLESLSQVTLDAAGQQKSGPLLSDLLQITGLSGFQRLTIQGLTNNLTLDVGEINDQVILDLSDPRLVTLVAGSFPPEEWVSGVTGIVGE